MMSITAFANTLMQNDYKSLISYYLREGFYQHAADEATEQIRRRGNDTYLLYWKGESIVLCTVNTVVRTTAPLIESTGAEVPHHDWFCL